MDRPARRRFPLGRTFVLLVVVGAIGAGAYVALTGPVSPDRLRAELERGMQRATGRRFTIGGPVHVGIGLSPSITAEGISLANIPGGSRPEMLTATSFRAQLALLPLLGGDVVIDEATLEQPDIILETAPDGTPNWQMHKPRHALYEGTPEPAEPRSGSSTEVEIHRIRVDGGTITYKPPSGPAITAQVDSLTIGADSAGAQMHGKMAARANGVQFTGTLQSGSFERLQGGAVTALAGAWPLTITLQGPGASLKVDGGVNHPDEMRGYEFLVTGNVQDMVPLYPWLPRVLQLPLHDVNFTTRLTDGPNGERRTAGLSLHAGSSDLSAAVQGLILKDAVFSAPGPGQQMQLSVDGIFQGAPLRLSGTATQPDTLAANVPVPVAISGQAASANLSIRGTVPASWNGLGFDLQVNVRAPNLADLSPLARRPLPDIRDVVFELACGRCRLSPARLQPAGHGAEFVARRFERQRDGGVVAGADAERVARREAFRPRWRARGAERVRDSGSGLAAGAAGRGAGAGLPSAAGAAWAAGCRRADGARDPRYPFAVRHAARRRRRSEPLCRAAHRRWRHVSRPASASAGP